MDGHASSLLQDALQATCRRPRCSLRAVACRSCGAPFV